MAGNWKQSDLPPPVGNSANTSLLARASLMISSCNGRKEVKPKYCFSNGNSSGALLCAGTVKLHPVCRCQRVALDRSTRPRARGQLRRPPAHDIGGFERRLLCRPPCLVGHILPWSCAREAPGRWATPTPRAAVLPGKTCAEERRGNGVGRHPKKSARRRGGSRCATSALRPGRGEGTPIRRCVRRHRELRVPRRSSRR